MKSGWEERRIWLAVGVTAVVAIVVFFLINNPLRELPPAFPPSPAHSVRLKQVGLTRLGASAGDKILREEATFYDPTPLFLPTRWNAGQNALPSNIIQEPGEVSRSYPAKLRFSGSELRLRFPAAIRVPNTPGDALAMLEPEQPFGGFGRTNRRVAPLPGRNGYVEIYDAGNGRPVLAKPLQNLRPPDHWEQPVEFMVAVDSAGLIAPPAITSGSGVDAVDHYLQDYLIHGLQTGQRLTPGFYRICMGP